MNKDQLIKVYGTLKNHTVDSAISDGNIHNDALALASDLYDDQFGESPKVNNFLDIINKRIKGIKRKEDSPNMGTHVNDDLYIGGPNNPRTIYIWDPNQGIYVPLNINNLLSHWHVDTDGKLVANDGKAAKAAGFYDTTVN